VSKYVCAEDNMSLSRSIDRELFLLYDIQNIIISDFTIRWIHDLW